MGTTEKSTDISAVYQSGDIFLVDSTKTGAKIVKFLMIAPTLWHWLFRKAFGGQNKVDYYHVGMVFNDKVIEQQSKVEFEDIYDAITKKEHYVVWRRKNLSEEMKINLLNRATTDLGKGYDILLILGRTLTWLTGIKWFTRHIQSKGKEFCVTRVAGWYKEVVGTTFGCKTYHEVTTDIIDDYCKAHLDEWERVDIK